ncbi:NAD-dependent epimerase/dehydratase family protein [Leifsonia poae]|uniref:NAD-dependent epimerase/dehydratase family protein n=1 Tax=Leifsonia poae TaxID=110933 RepID=UPI003D676AFB
MRILVTGAGGRLGTALVARLERDDHEVTAVVSPRSPDDAARVRLDLADTAAVSSRAREARPEAIVHVGAIVGAACEADPAATRAVNIEATRALGLVAAERAARLIFVSTSAVYGTGYTTPVDEDGPLDLGSAYARSKREAELVLDDLANGADLDVVSLRVFNLFGPGFTDSLVSRLERATPDRPALLYGLDGYVRDYVHVDDTTDLIARALRTPSLPRVLNVGSGQATSNRRLIDLLTIDPAAYRVENAPPSYSCADISLATSVLGFAPTHTMETHG